MIGRTLSVALEEFPDEIQHGINALSQGISIFSKDLILIFYNSAFQTLLDLPDELFLNHPHFTDLIRFNALRGEYGDVDVEAKVDELHQLARDFQPHHFFRTTASGVILEIKGIPLPDGGFVTTYTDVTEVIKTQTEFKKASQRFKDFTEAASDWYWETDEDCRFTFFSERLEDVLGVDTSALLGKKRGELSADPDDIKWKLHREVTENRQPFENFEYEIHTKHGSKFCSVSGKPIFSEAGEFMGYRGVGKEITAEVMIKKEIDRNLADQIILSKILELSLRDLPLEELLESILKVIFKHNQRGILSKGCIFFANEKDQTLRMVASVGLADEILKSCRRLNYGTCLCGSAAQTKTITYKSHVDEDHHITFDGIKPHGHYCVPIIQDKELTGILNLYIEDGHQKTDREVQFLTSVSNTISGIISRWKTQQEFRKLSQAVEQNPAAIVITDISGKINYVNQAFVDSSGYTREEVLGQTPAVLKSGNTPQEEYKKLWATISLGRVWRGVFHNKKKDGTFIWERATIVPIKNREGKVVSYVGIKENITALKEQEEKQTYLEQELRQSQKMEAIGQLAGGIAHEINTPTQYVSDNLVFMQETWTDLKELHALYDQLLEVSKGLNVPSDLLEDIQELKDELDFDLLSDDVEEALTDAIGGTKQISRIVKAMKDFSHPGQKEMVMADLNAAIKSTSTVCRNEWKYVAELDFDLDDTLPQIQCLPGELNQVFLNLIVNAAHAIEERNKAEQEKKTRTIKIRTSQSAGYVLIEVQDEGNGIPLKVRDKIFNPFFTTKIVGKGTGQGLAISHDVIVNKHSGRIWFETEEGAGTTFKVSLPIERDQHISQEQM